MGADKQKNFMSNQLQQTPVWFVTGASNGIGFELVSHLLKQGFRVTATTRDVDRLCQRLGADANSAAFLPIAVDLTSENSVCEAIQTTVNQFGRIDVVVNNAAFVQMGSLEEVTDGEARDVFDVNVFGMLNVIRQAMPYLRKQQSGHFLNFSSLAGLTGAVPGAGVYSATKFAVEGLSEALSVEAAPFGIKVTIIEPAAYRTGFHKSGSVKLSQIKLEQYGAARQTEAYLLESAGDNPGDPAKAANALIQIVGHANPPLHLVLGQFAYTLTYSKMKALQDDMATWKELSFSTEFSPST